MSLGSQYLNLFLQVILRRIITVAHQQVGWISSVFMAKYTWQKRTGTTDCIPGDNLSIWHSICCQSWVWKIFIWLWMIRCNGKKRETFSNASISSFGIDLVTLIALEIYLAMDMCMSKHAYLQPICKNRGWFYIEEAIWNAAPVPHTTQLSHFECQSGLQLQYQISRVVE